jgi:hypothetical protein
MATTCQLGSASELGRHGCGSVPGINAGLSVRLCAGSIKQSGRGRRRRAKQKSASCRERMPRRPRRGSDVDRRGWVRGESECWEGLVVSESRERRRGSEPRAPSGDRAGPLPLWLPIIEEHVPPCPVAYFIYSASGILSFRGVDCRLLGANLNCTNSGDAGTQLSD